MEYFLERIAKELLSTCKDRMHTQCLVFPNRRAGLFFIKYLAGEINKPVWTPSVMTINELFRSLTILKPAEIEILLFELFKVYRKIRKKEETFDDFYFWGDMILNDFDDIDKYLVDASRLFHNVQDLRNIDQLFGGLTPEQIEIIKRFWTNFNPDKPTAEKSGFISVWSILSDLYQDYKAALASKNIAYEGMIFRNVIETESWIKKPGIRWETVHFIGFNALNECEKKLMSALQQKGKARFYWDFDNSYIREGDLNSAGYFLRKNLALFGNDIPTGWEYNTLLSRGSGKVIRNVIEASSDVAQVKLIPGLLKKLPDLRPDNAHQTAILLSDENLLVPVLTSLPGDISEINITMGYPLRETDVYILIKNLFDLHKNAKQKNGSIYFAYRDVVRVLKNNLISDLLNGSGDKILREITSGNILFVPSSFFKDSMILSEIFKKPSEPELLPDYLKKVLLLIVSNSKNDENPDNITHHSLRNEFVYRTILAVNRLKMILEDPEVKINTDTLTKLLDRILRLQSVPFSGEPLAGIQIMGILETRALDFKNLVILSVNEGLMPSFTAASSFIPFSLREAFGLPSINHQESIYAYHFYRLMHRAENVTFLFNSNSEGIRSGEISRFLQQMKYESSLKPEYMNLEMEIRNPVSPSAIVERSGDLNNRLLSGFLVKGKAKILSPSALNTWLGCRMRFYYRYVNDLREPEKISEEIDPAMLGTILHKIMNRLYSGLVGIEVGPDKIEAIRKNQGQLSQMIVNTIKESFLNEDDSYLVINELIVRNVLQEYINRILEIDKKTAPFKIIELEQPVKFKIIPDNLTGNSEITLGGIIDRVDIKDGITRIVDYKTGITSDSIKSVNELFREDRKKESDCWLQTLLYCEGYLKQDPKAVVVPSVYKLKKLPGDDSADKLIIREGRNEHVKIENYNSIREFFMEGLQKTVNTIFNMNEPFIMTRDAWNKCPNCPYRRLCKR
jgi:hypothetical protein